VERVDAFDYSEQMIERAKAGAGETNSRFFVDNLLAPASISSTYDAVLCVRVLINLKNLDEQKTALSNLESWVKPGGFLILVEGYTDGFAELSALRVRLGLPRVAPAPINYYSSLSDIQSAVSRNFKLDSNFHLGSYDFLTRVVYPSVVGQDNVVPNSHFAEKASEIAREFNPAAMKPLSRIQGLVFRRAI
jgi:SAM-dependent methyltransferase